MTANTANHTFSRNEWVFGLAAFGGKANQTSYLWFLGRGLPGLQNTSWPRNHFGIPLRECPAQSLLFSGLALRAQDTGSRVLRHGLVTGQRPYEFRGLPGTVPDASNNCFGNKKQISGSLWYTLRPPGLAREEQGFIRHRCYYFAPPYAPHAGRAPRDPRARSVPYAP